MSLVQLSFEESNEMMRTDPSKFRQHVQESLRRHAAAVNKLCSKVLKATRPIKMSQSIELIKSTYSKESIKRAVCCSDRSLLLEQSTLLERLSRSCTS